MLSGLESTVQPNENAIPNCNTARQFEKTLLNFFV